MEYGFSDYDSAVVLSRIRSSLQNGFCTEDKWRCVRAVYQPPKSSLNLTLSPQNTFRSFSSGCRSICSLAQIGAERDCQTFLTEERGPITWRPFWWAPCLRQTLWAAVYSAQQAVAMLSAERLNTTSLWASVKATLHFCYTLHLVVLSERPDLRRVRWLCFSASTDNVLIIHC